jgi:hypothetical protein
VSKLPVEELPESELVATQLPNTTIGDDPDLR